MGALEHSVMPKVQTTDPPAAPQYSPLHLVDKNHGWGKDGLTGGNEAAALGYLTRGGGPVDETTVPYATVDLEPLKITGKQISYPPVKWVREILLNSNQGWWQTLENDFGRDCIYHKRTGGVLTHFYMDQAQFNPDYNSYFYGSALPLELNHQAVIIGWDDDFDKDKFYTFPKVNGALPSYNGAIIIKNSWGLFGDQGYIYVSACDLRIRPMFAFTSVKEPTYKYTYQYDLLGPVANYGYERTADGQAVWAANVFEAENPPGTDDIIKAVSFYLPNDDAYQCNFNYEIKVYTNVHHPSDPKLVPNDPKHGDLAATITGQGDPTNYPNYGYYKYGGYFTIDLPNPVTITGGTKFSVVIKYTRVYYELHTIGFPIEKSKRFYHYNDDGTPDFNRERNNTLNASYWPGETFFSKDGENWFDMKNEGNACIKAFTDGNFDHDWKLKDALDDPELNITSDNGYNLNWKRVIDVTDGIQTDAAQSGWINVGERCHMEANIYALDSWGANVSFFWKVSSDPDNSLKLYIDQDPQEILSNCVYRGKYFQATCCTPSMNLTPAKTSGIRLY